MKDHNTTHEGIRYVAMEATKYITLFEKIRTACDYHAQNTLTKHHNCFYGNTKKVCDAILCPLKGEKT